MRRPSDTEIRNALAAVIFDANNHPDPSAVLGKSITPLVNATTDAMIALLNLCEEPGEGRDVWSSPANCVLSPKESEEP